MSATEFDLGLGVLDHQLVDSEGRNCANVDDLEIAGVSTGEPEVTEIIVGGNAWKGRGFFGRIAARRSRATQSMSRGARSAEIGAVVTLKHRAQELRLGRGDDKAARFVKRLPGA